MDKAEKIKESWRERKTKIKHKWAKPFIFIEWLCERVSYVLERWALLDICGHIGRFGVLVSIIVGMCVYVMEADDRQEEVENQRKAKHYQAWQVINAAQGKMGSGGRIDALQDLHKDGISLAGVDISLAHLQGLNLENANFVDANLAGADLLRANLSKAYLWSANLTGAYLRDANLAGANLFGANLTGADLRYANLKDIKFWQRIRSIERANIYDVKNPPDGFIEWAKEHGAVIIQDAKEWEKFIREKNEQKADNSRENQ